MRSGFLPVRAGLPFALLVALPLALAGCAGMSPAPDQTAAPVTDTTWAAWQAHAADVKTLNDWAFAGRAAIRSGVTGGSVQIDWTQVGDVSAVALRGPFDSGRLALTGTPERMLITDGAGNRRLSDSPADLLEELTGWQIPLAALPRWLRGLPHAALERAGMAEENFDDVGRLRAFRESGWTIRYERYASAGARDLPHFLELQREHMGIRLIVDRWDVQ
jgi:outer membrane lipoprotein LolB